MLARSNICSLCFIREYLAAGARDPVNVDSKVAETVRRKLNDNPDRYCFDEAVVSILSSFFHKIYTQFIRLSAILLRTLY